MWSRKSFGKSKRKINRQPLAYTAWIDSADGVQPTPTQLFDISPRGAGLSVANPHVVPDIFCLRLAERGKHVRLCKVMWRRADRIGVSFIGPVAGATRTWVDARAGGGDIRKTER